MINLPAIYKLYDKEGKRRLFVFGGGFPAYSSMSEDDGETWRDITPLGAYGFESTINSIIELGKGEYIGFFHDNGMFYKPGNRLMEVWHTGEGDDARTKAIWRVRTEDGGWNAGRRYGSVPVHEREDDDWKLIHAFPCNGPYPDKAWDVFSIKTTDGGLTWSEPKHLLHDARAQYMEPGSIKSPDGKQILMMLRSESRGYNSFAMVSNDNGETWSVFKRFNVTSAGAFGFWTTGQFRNGECLTGFVGGNGLTFVRPLVVTEGNHKFGSSGLDLDGDIFVKLNSNSVVTQL
jgi:hypothetical protein